MFIFCYCVENVHQRLSARPSPFHAERSHRMCASPACPFIGFLSCLELSSGLERVLLGDVGSWEFVVFP